jgi:hypothetical protein
MRASQFKPGNRPAPNVGRRGVEDDGYTPAAAGYAPPLAEQPAYDAHTSVWLVRVVSNGAFLQAPPGQGADAAAGARPGATVPLRAGSLRHLRRRTATRGGGHRRAWGAGPIRDRRPNAAEPARQQAGRWGGALRRIVILP